MEFAYIAVTIIAGLALGFAFLCAVWIAKRVSRGIRDRSVELISSYDIIFEEKKEKLDAVIRETQRAAEMSTDADTVTTKYTDTKVDDIGAVVSVAEKVATAGYRNKDFGEDYKNIRTSFTHDPESMAGIVDKTVKKDAGEATKLLEQLDYSTVYSISTFPADEQLAILNSVFDINEKHLLEEYLSIKKNFSMIGFYDFLKAKASLEPQWTTLVVSAADAARSYPEWISVRKDEDIIEGFEIETGGELYDYSIRKREVV